MGEGGPLAKGDGASDELNALEEEALLGIVVTRGGIEGSLLG